MKDSERGQNSAWSESWSAGNWASRDNQEVKKEVMKRIEQDDK